MNKQSFRRIFYAVFTVPSLFILYQGYMILLVPQMYEWKLERAGCNVSFGRGGYSINIPSTVDLEHTINEHHDKINYLSEVIESRILSLTIAQDSLDQSEIQSLMSLRGGILLRIKKGAVTEEQLKTLESNDKIGFSLIESW